MAENIYKGTAIEFVRRVVQEERDPSVERALLALLTDEEAVVYKSTLPFSWVPIAPSAAVLEKGASVLYPDDPAPVRRLGRELAVDNLNGVYKILLRIATVPYVINKTAKIWSAYHKKGTATSTLQPGGKAGRVEVADYPDLPPAIRDTMSGYVVTILEMTGAIHIEVVEEPFADGKWAWHITWS